MLRISKLTDYATVILARLAAQPQRRYTATQMAAETRLTSATVSKLLKQLHRHGLVLSTRGLHGGYLLARPAVQITAAQIVDALRALSLAQIIRAANDNKREWWRQPHRDHIGSDELTQPDASVKPFGREVDQPLACGDLQLDLGVGLAERSDHRLQNQRYGRAGNGDAQEPGGTLAQVPRGLAGGDELLKGGPGAFEEASTGFGEADAAGRPDEQRRADPRLERADRLAHRRRRDAELGGRAAKAAVLGDAEERLDAVERALPDCEALLHGASRLSRIVVREKRAYIGPANEETRRWRRPTDSMACATTMARPV